MTKPSRNEKLDSLIMSNLRVDAAPPLPSTALEDLRYFESKAAQGYAIKVDALQAYLQDEHKFPVGQTRLHTLCVQNGVKPWWSKK